jgi:CheY-like chemotaxis protein
MRGFADRRKINIQLKEHKEVVDDTYIGDEIKIRQVLNNIINNAVKFSRSNTNIKVSMYIYNDMSEVKIHIAELNSSGYIFYSNQDPPMLRDNSMKWIMFIVQDSGSGIDESKVHTIFEPYAQLSDGVTKEQQGTGLGLSISLTNVHVLGGTICVISGPSGSTFIVVVPLLCGLSQRSISNVSDDRKSTTEENTNHYHFLLIDDNKVNNRLCRRKLESLLGKENVTCIIEDDGDVGTESYLQCCKENKTLTAIFVDYHMPRMCGVDVIKNIRRYEKLNNITKSFIIAYTADMTEDARRVLFECGADEIFVKPTAPKLFDRTILKLVRPI